MNFPLFSYEWNLIQAWAFFAALAFAFIAHEAGHYAVLRSYGRKPKIWFDGESFNVGTAKDYILLTKTERKNVFWGGILAGLVPLLVPVFLLLYPPFSVGLVAIYLAGCKHDFKQIVRLRKWRQN